MNIDAIRHEMILASAGSGKTHKLTLRYIRLMALGVEPERILALTFTRKAAGEFFERILLQLSEGVESESAATKLANAIELPELTREGLLDLLDRLVRAMGRLTLGTIDSFFHRMVSQFPLELGLSGDFRVVDPYEESVLKESVLKGVIEDSSEELRENLLQHFKDATWGAEEKSVFERFKDLFKVYHQKLLENSDTNLWGMTSAIWPQLPWWISAKITQSPEEIFQKLKDNLDPASFGDKRFGDAVVKLLASLENMQPGTEISGSIWAQILLQMPLPPGAVFTFHYYKKDFEFNPVATEALFQVVTIWLRAEISRRLSMTRGTFEMLNSFEERYQRQVREVGQLVFADFVTLLSRSFSEHGESALASELLQYRLDSRYDHWLMDEFQDTSRLQWRVLQPLVDEILQDASGERSFFYVGDVKQAIYGWRGGDSRLFEEIFRHYNQEEKRIHDGQLNVSWRSSPFVLDFVNAVCNLNAGSVDLLGGAGERWNRNWNTHVASPKTAKDDGHAALFRVDDKQAVEERIVELVRALDPVGRGLSCGILCRANKVVREVTNALREQGFAVGMEGGQSICTDNEVGLWVKTALETLAHPGTVFSRDWLEMMGFPLLDSDLDDLRTLYSREGLISLVQNLLDRLEPMIAENGFLGERAGQILEATIAYVNQEPAGQLDRFWSYLSAYTLAEVSSSEKIQAMSIHKSKGLAFDVVIIADLDTEDMAKMSHADLHLQRSETGISEWLLFMPRKDYIGLDEQLERARRSREEELYFESLCSLYVAMTRARQGLYIFNTPLPKNGNSVRYQSVFQTQLHGSDLGEWEYLPGVQVVFETGNRNWLDNRPQATRTLVQPTALVPVDNWTMPLPAVFRAATAPSREKSSVIPVHQSLFGGPLQRAGLSIGSAIHEALALTDFINVQSVETLVENLVEDGHLDAMYSEIITRFLHSEEGKRVFSRPAGYVELWREKAFILRKDGLEQRGIMDRVVFLEGAGGTRSAIIYDFKTDSASSQADLDERYASQMTAYREAVHRLTDIPHERIETHLIAVAK